MYHLLNVLSEEEIDAFTKGDCAFLAEEILDIRPDDFAMLILTDIEDESSIEACFYHVVAQHLQTGYVLDAEGIWNVEDVIAHYDQDGIAEGDIFVEEYSMSLYFDQGGSGRAYHQNPRTAAYTLLEAFDAFLQKERATTELQ